MVLAESWSHVDHRADVRSGAERRAQRESCPPRKKPKRQSLPVEMPKLVTVTRDACGRYFASFTVETTPREAPPPKRPSVGVDAGVKTLATLSDGTKFENPRALKRHGTNMGKLQQRLARQCKGSRRREGTRKRIARVHRRDCGLSQ